MSQEKIINGKVTGFGFFRWIKKRRSGAHQRANFEVTGKRAISLLTALAIIGTMVLPTLTSASSQQNQDAINALASFNIMATNVPPPPPNTNPNVLVLPYDGPPNRHPHAGTLDDINVVVPLVMDAAARKLKYYNQPSSPQAIQAELKAVSTNKDAWFKFAPFMLQVGWESVMATNPTPAQQAMYKYFQRYYGIQSKFTAQYTLLQWYRYSKQHAASVSPMQMLIDTGPNSETFREQFKSAMGIQRNGVEALDRLFGPSAIAEYAQEFPEEFTDDPDLQAGVRFNQFLAGMGFGAGTGTAVIGGTLGIAVIPTELSIIGRDLVGNAAIRAKDIAELGKAVANNEKAVATASRVARKIIDTFAKKLGNNLTEDVAEKLATAVGKQLGQKLGQRLAITLGTRMLSLGSLVELAGQLLIVVTLLQAGGTKIAEVIKNVQFIDELNRNATQPDYNVDIRSRLVALKAPARYYRGQRPMACGPNQEENAGLCYQKCRPGERGVATFCYTDCPSNLRDDGLYCGKPGEYGRGGGYPAWDWDRCEREQGKGKCEWWGAMIYPKCKPGYAPFGCCLCKPACPPGWEDIGVSCKKPSWNRGVGTPLSSCPPGFEKQGALCYPVCKPGYDGRLDWCYPNANAVAERLPDDDDIKANKISFFSWMVKMMIADAVDGLPFGRILQLSLGMDEQDFKIPGYPLTLAEQGFGRSATDPTRTTTNPSQPTNQPAPASRPGQPTPAPQPKSGATLPRETLLDEEQVRELVDDLAARLEALITDETVLEAIDAKWQKLTLVGKTKRQIVELLFAEVKSQVKDEGTLDRVWRRWSRHTEDRARP